MAVKRIDGGKMKRGWAVCSLIFLFGLVMAGESPAGTIVGNVAVERAKNPYIFVVHIDKAEGEFKPPEELVHMDQKDVKFLPKVLPVLVGTTVEFLNSDTQKHNVFGFGDNDDFNLGTWDPGGKESHTFNNLGVITALCNIHAEMEGFIVVLQNPFFAVTDEAGNYDIKDVPAGTYILKAWNNSLEPAEQEIVVPDSGNVTANFEIKR